MSDLEKEELLGQELNKCEQIQKALNNLENKMKHCLSATNPVASDSAKESESATEIGEARRKIYKKLSSIENTVLDFIERFSIEI